MNLKKPISAAMAAMMTLSVTATPVLAAVEDPPGTATQADEQDADSTLGEQSSAEEDALESSDTSEKSHQDAKVYAFANGSYILTVPESINLHNVEKKDLGSGLYTNDKHCKVNLRGDVRQDQVVVVTVTEPVMQSEGSKDVDATVDTSSKTVWNRDDLFTGATAGEDGSYTEPTGVTTVYPVSAELTPGNWVGTAMFNCSLETTSSIASVITGIDPDSFDYDGQAHTPTLIFADDSAPVEGRDYVISGDTAKVEEGDYTLTVTGSGKYYGEASFAWKIKRYDISASLDQSSFVADDAEHTPNIIWGASNLVEGADYEISGTKSATDPGNYQITISGKGKYKGTLTLDWTITATDIATIVDGLDENAFGNDGLEHAPNIVWKNGYSPVEGKDYEISGTTSSSEDGTYTITIKGKGKYTGSVDLDWRIAPKQDIAAIDAKLNPTDFIADDTEHAPTIVWPEGSKFTENVDYTIGGIQSATAVGDYTITITGKGKYKGTLDLGWTISATDIATVVDGLVQDFFANDGEEHSPEIIWKDGKVLVEGKDYDLSGDISSTDEGTYTTTITGKGNYNGSVSYTWTVSTVDISVALAGITPAHFDYDGEEHSPELIWADGYSGTEDVDYTLSGDVSKSDNGDYTLKVTGKGKYKGTVSFDWNIRELIPVGETYTAYLTGEQYIGDGVTVYFPLTAENNDTYVNSDYTYTCRNGWSVIANDKLKSKYGSLRSRICDKFVVNMSNTFDGCKNLIESPVIPEKVTDMTITFRNCASLVKAPKIPSNVRLMGFGAAMGEGTFIGCTSLEEAPILPDSVINVSGLFSSCINLKTYDGSQDPEGDFSNYKIPHGLTSQGLYSTFYTCSRITKAPVIPDDITCLVQTFEKCSSLVDAPIIPSKVTDMRWAFCDCTSLTGTLICNANPGSYGSALYNTKVNVIEGSCSDATKIELLKTTNKTILTNDTVLLVSSTIKYDGGSHIPQVKYNDTVLTAGEDYILTGDTEKTECGEYVVTVTGVGEYVGRVRMTWFIAKQRMEDAIVGLEQTHFEYDGNEHRTNFSWNTGFENFVEGQDYSVSGTRSATAPGYYTIAITGLGEYKGTVWFSWYIGELIPTGCVYTTAWGVKTTGDGKTVVFPIAKKGDTYQDAEYKYTCSGDGWSESPLSKNKKSYGDIRSSIGYKPVIGCSFWGCEYLVVAPVIPDSVTNMYSTFYNCTSLTEAPAIPDGVTDMGSTFSGCTKLTKAPVIPDSVTSMSSTFYGCTSLAEAPVIPDSVTSMSSTFSGCTSLAEAPVIPDSVTNMSRTFYGCTSLTEAPVIPDSVTNMSLTFYGCKNLTNAPTIPAAVTDVSYVFNNCFALEGTLTCNANPSSYSNALYNTKVNAVMGDCSDTTELNLLKTTGKSVLTNDSVALVTDVLRYDGNTHTPQIRYNGTTLTAGKDYSLSGDIEKTDIGEYTVTVIGIGNYVGKIDLTWYIANHHIDEAIAGLSQSHFDYDGNEHTPGINWNNGFERFTEGQDYFISGTNSATDKGNYIITIKGLGEYKGAISFTWSIGELIPLNAVYTIKSTNKSLVGDGLTVVFPMYVYQNDTYVDESYTYTYNRGKDYGSDWSVKVSNTSKSSYGALRSYICDKPVTNMYDTFYKCTSLKEAPVIPDKVTDMGYTFCGCTSLTKAPVIPDRVKDLDGTFSGCTSLVEAPVIPDSVTAMNYTFSNCTSLVKVPAISNGVTRMRETFKNCKSLESVPSLGKNVREMQKTFYNCVSLTETPVIPDRVENLDGTFLGCTSLTEAPVIPKSVTSMEETFYGCTSLTGTLTCNTNLLLNINPSCCRDALYKTKITAIEGSCSDYTKYKLLETR